MIYSYDTGCVARQSSVACKQQISDVLIIVDENMEYVNGCFILDDDDDYSLEKFKKVIDKVISKNRK